MISRRCSRFIAEAYEASFRKYHRSGSYSEGYYTLDTSRLYDFLFDNDHAAYFCNAAKKTRQSTSTRGFKEFLMRLHTGESLINATPDWSWEQREKLGQRYIHDLAEDILNHWSDRDTQYISKDILAIIDRLRNQLELEGYVYRDGRLLEPEVDVLDVKEEVGVLQSLYRELGLANQETAFHHLNLTEEHYLAERWDDSISNSRKFLESILQEIAAAYSGRVQNEEVPSNIYTRPVRVRDYLEKEGLLEPKEKEAIASVYSLLSNTGGHPYMAQAEQARLLRHLALTFSQFVMLRLRGRFEATV